MEKTFEEVKAASDSVFMAWKNAGQCEACDSLNNSNRDMILAYTKRYPSAKAYKMWQGIVDIDLENLHNFCFDVLFDGQSESVKQIEQAQDEIARLNAADVAKIAKDYIKIIGGKDAVVKVPLRLFAGEDKLILAMTHNGYSTTDEVEISESNIPTHASRFPGYYMSMFSSVYTADIFGNLDGNVTVKFGNQYAPVMIESNGYIGLLLPVREGKCDEYPYITTNNLAVLAGIAMAEEVA